jgi:hypothetical protein
MASVKLPMWYRVLASIVGVLSIVLALIVLVEPVLALWLLIFLLALGLLFMGMDRLVVGISGHPLAWVEAMLPPSMSSAAGGTPPGSSPPPKT